MKNRTMHLKNFSNKYKLLFVILCAFCLLLPLYGKAQEDKIPASETPSHSGKLETSLPEEMLREKETPSLSTDTEYQKIDAPETNGDTTGKTEKTKINTPNPGTAKDIILQTNRNNALIVDEGGSDLLTTKNSKIQDNYSNSTQLNNGFYMNITNPDGSSMNFGTYFNSNTSSNGPRRKSSSQIVVDKK